jgi:flagellar protein FliO/FliZ
MALSLGIIIILIISCAYAIRKVSLGQLRTDGAIQIVTSLSLGAREKLVLIQIGGQQILLAMTPSEITKLVVFDEPVVSSEQDSGLGNFKRTLQEIMTKGPPR